MHPATSIIVFTTVSGAGYGLLALLALGGLLGLLPADAWFGGIGLGAGLGLVALGLLSSLLHLGHPERAWRALSQWRSSWLSREGVLALLSFLPVLGLACGWIFAGQVWALPALAVLVIAGATVYATSMIYGSLKPVRQWHVPLVPCIYLVSALASGSLLLVVLLAAFALPLNDALVIALGCTLSAGLVLLRYWTVIDSGAPLATAGSATGLSALGSVRMLEPPHTEENYLLREMGYQVARKHAAKLRRIAFVLAFVLAPLLLLALFFLPTPLLALLAATANLTGTLTARWLFFAEATHTVTLYYGRAA